MRFPLERRELGRCHEAAHDSGRAGKSCRAAGIEPRTRNALLMAAQPLAVQVGVAPACQALGVARATFRRFPVCVRRRRSWRRRILAADRINVPHPQRMAGTVLADGSRDRRDITNGRRIEVGGSRKPPDLDQDVPRVHGQSRLAQGSGLRHQTSKMHVRTMIERGILAHRRTMMGSLCSRSRSIETPPMAARQLLVLRSLES